MSPANEIRENDAKMKLRNNFFIINNLVNKLNLKSLEIENPIDLLYFQCLKYFIFLHFINVDNQLFSSS